MTKRAVSSADSNSGIPREVFVPRMVELWKSLGNQTSPVLEKAWGELVESFNRQITGEPEPMPPHGTITFPDKHMLKWSVVPMPTGTGKTKCLELYCALLAKHELHPGILIVTQFIGEADKLRKNINELAGVETAISYHSENYDKLEIACEHSPVLIITHAAFKRILNAEAKQKKYSSNWEHFMKWQESLRKLVVIDEVLNVVEHISITPEDVMWLQAIMPVEVTKDYKNEITVIDSVIIHLLNKRHDHDGTETMVTPEEWSITLPYDLEALSSALRDVVAEEAMYHEAGGKQDDNEDAPLYNPNATFTYASYRRCAEVLSGLQHILNSWGRFSKVVHRFRLTSAFVILPPELQHAVILDATAEPNKLYAMLGNVPDYKWLPDNIRNYRNVTLHVFWGKGLGKIALQQQPQEYFTQVVEGLSPYIGAKNKVLFCSAKAVERHFQAVTKGKYQAVGTMHWGAIAGKNHWNDYDSLVIYGVQSLPLETPKNAFAAFQDWHNKTGNKFEQPITYVNDGEDEYMGEGYTSPLQEHEVYLAEEDYQHNEFAIGQITTDLIQAMNRVRCRGVIDVEGNCEPTSIYLFMNREQKFRTVLENVIRMMPGVVVHEQGREKAQPKSRVQDTLVEHLKTLEPGQYDAEEIRELLEITPRTMERIAKQIKDENSDLKRQLDALGIRYDAKPGKGGYKVFFIGKSGGN